MNQVVPSSHNLVALVSHLQYGGMVITRARYKVDINILSLLFFYLLTSAENSSCWSWHHAEWSKWWHKRTYDWNGFQNVSWICCEKALRGPEAGQRREEGAIIPVAAMRSHAKEKQCYWWFRHLGKTQASGTK